MPIANSPQGSITSQPYSKFPANSPLGSNLVKKILLIVGILIVLSVTVGIVFYLLRTSKISARDNQRKADVKKIASSLEDFRQKTQNQLYYPGAITEETLVKTGLLDQVPIDPTSSDPYTYHFFRSPDGCVANCTGFSLTACLENSRDSQKDLTTNSVCPVASYTVNNK